MFTSWTKIAPSRANRSRALRACSFKLRTYQTPSVHDSRCVPVCTCIGQDGIIETNDYLTGRPPISLPRIPYPLSICNHSHGSMLTYRAEGVSQVNSYERYKSPQSRLRVIRIDQQSTSDSKQPTLIKKTQSLASPIFSKSKQSPKKTQCNSLRSSPLPLSPPLQP